MHLGAVFVATVPKAPSTTTSSPAAAGFVVTVTAGKPSEFSFLLSTQVVPPGVVTFEITNSGTEPHNFEICSVTSDATANSCVGTTSTTLSGAGGGGPSSASLTVTLSTPGTYEYLSTVPGQATAGMKGLLDVSVPD
jgi:plastocyanin